MQAKVLKVNDGDGYVMLTYKRLAAENGKKRLEEAFENKEVLTAKVSQVTNGGLTVVVEETRVFIPSSLVSDTYEKDLSKYAGQEISFVITEFNTAKRRIIGDRKQLLVAEKQKRQEEVLSKISVGQTVEGTVKNVTDSVYSSISAEWMVFFTSLRCHGEELRILRRYLSLVIMSRLSLRIFRVTRLPFHSSLRILIHGLQQSRSMQLVMWLRERLPE